MNVSIGASSAAFGVIAWQKQQDAVPPAAAPAVAASASAEAQIATASAAMATGTTVSVMA